MSNRENLDAALAAAGIAPRPFYTVADAARITGLNPNTVYMSIYARNLAAVRIGRAVRIPAPALAEFIYGGVAA